MFPTMYMSKIEELLKPDKLWSRNEILSKPCPVPVQSGVYGWYFRNVPSFVPTDNCVKKDELTLLYVGISPKAPPTNDRPASNQNLKQRIKYHLNGNAEGSTLRLTLGCILSETLGIQLRRVGSGKRMTFVEGERILSQWLSENAFVTWIIVSEPWKVEEELIKQVSLPLNLDQNRNHNFHQKLSELRSKAKAIARELPIVL